MTDYGITEKLDCSYEEAVQRTKDELEEHGFGVLSEIDVSEKFKKKLDVDFDDYIILGACNPEMAYRAIQKEQKLGLLLPCNFIVHVEDDETFVSAIKPTKVLEVPENSDLHPIAEKVEEELNRVVKHI